MNINNLDIELNTKAKESFKSLLKKPNVEILFGIPTEDGLLTTINESNHHFILIKNYINTELLNINEKYYNLLTTELKTKLRELTMKEKTHLLKWKTWYLLFLVPFHGKRFNVTKEKIERYKLNYNSVIMDLSKLEYDRFFYYTQYVYKLQQLQKLNKELNIQQEFSIMFDDDKSAKELYKNMYDNLKGLLGSDNSN